MAKVLIGNFKGPKGDKGDKGNPGTAATIQVGTTQTVQPEANAEVTNSGTANAAVLNFKIPRGEDGMTDLTAEYKDASEYTCEPTVNAPVVLKEISGKTEQGADPSPDNPQVIKGVGGMGYFDGEWRQGVYQAANGTWQAAGNGICSQNPINAKAGDNVTLKYPDEAALVILAYKNDGTYLGNNAVQNANEVSYTLPTDTAYVHIDVQLAQGTSITPSTTKYCTVAINGKYASRVESNGKNLVDFDKYYNEYGFNGEYSGQIKNFTEIKIPIPGLLIGKKLTFSAYLKTSVGLSNARVWVNASGLLINGNYVNNTENYEISKVTFTANKGDYINFNYSDGGSSILNIKSPQLEEAETPTEYEPYHHTALSIPLTSPLYEGDKVCYVKPGESYVDSDGTTVIANRILYGVYRENAEVVFDGSEDWETNGENNRYYLNLNNSNNIYTENTAKCNFFKYNANVYYDTNNEIGFIVSKNIFYCRFSSASEINLVSNLKTWLSNNPLTIVYRLAQPYFEPFADQNIFYTLRTDDTLSYVYSGDPIEPVLTVEVAKNGTGGYLLESYAQAQKNAISEANSQSRISAIEQQLVNQATTPTE